MNPLIAAARECLGTPFRHQGRIVGLGLDCAGVICHAMAQCGIPYRDTVGYPRQPYAGMLQSVLDDQPAIVAVPVDAIRPGDILLMRFTGEPQHLALFAGDTIIHAYEHVGKCCEHRFAEVWRSRVVQAYRVRGEA